MAFSPPDHHTPKRQVTLASFGIVLGGALWGLFWVPVRFLGDLGLAGAWPGAVIYLGGAVLILPIILLRWRSMIRLWRPLLLCGVCTGAGFSLYSSSLMLTEIVRAILLFYLTPVWGTLLGLAFLGERLTINRILALGLGLGGLVVVLGIGEAVPLPRNLGEWLAIGSGLAWAIGSMFLYRSGSLAVPEQVAAFILGSIFITGVTLLIGGAALGAPPGRETLNVAAPWALLCAVYALPMLFLTIWPATVLTPGRVGLLLMSDVVVGIASAAAFAGEPFGWREGAGTILIVAAGLVEVMGKQPQTGPD